MDKKTIFDWLVAYHIGVNLEACLPHMQDGRIIGTNGKPLTENLDYYVQPHQGLLVVANGESLANRLKKDRVVHDDEIHPFTPTSNAGDFFRYLSEYGQGDGAYVFDGLNSRVTKIQELDNNPSTLPENLDLYSMVPPDFFFYDAHAHRAWIGNKTRLAIKLPHAYDSTDTYQIKRSPYTEFGMGKVTHFNRQGLVEEFFFMYDPSSDGPFIKPDQGIIGVYRSYERNPQKRLIRTLEKLVDVSQAASLVYCGVE